MNNTYYRIATAAGRDPLGGRKFSRADQAEAAALPIAKQRGLPIYIEERRAGQGNAKVAETAVYPPR